MHKIGKGYNPKLNLSAYGVIPDRIAFFGNIEKITEDNTMYRAVIFTSDNEQLVVMSIPPGTDIGAEIHSDTDQFFRIESGSGTLIIGTSTPNQVEHISFSSGASIQVPMGTFHNLVADKGTTIKLYTVYSPPHHRYDVIQATK
jgi:mannose-6-phosphate isomerase-like protein (cupin superfamily)